MSTIEERFWAKVDVAAPDECWEWTASRRETGYGQIAVGRKPVKAHRLSFFLANGYWPPVVRHTCDNPPCVNPAHLLAGTVKDNVRDMIERGQYSPPPTGKGSANPQSKLTEADVLLARRMRADGATFRSVAARFGVDRRTITQAIKGEGWRHV